MLERFTESRKGAQPSISSCLSCSHAFRSTHSPIGIIKPVSSAIGMKDTEIVNTIIRLGKTLDLKVLAEGIETKEQAEKLLEQQCDEGQGYLFNKPLELKWIRELLEP